jgi:phosphoenolpyruvate carboxykinase (ATP)
MPRAFDLTSYGITNLAYRNLNPARLYEDAVAFDGGRLSASGALVSLSGEKTGRSPKEKRIVDTPGVHDDVWWGSVNIPLSTKSFEQNRARAIEHLSTCDRLYVVDGFAGWEAANRIRIRVICERPYHALFMHNMLIRPTADELAEFGEPDYVIFGAGRGQADPDVAGNTSPTSVALDFDRGEMVVLGTEYAGELKKGVFTIMNYLMPKAGRLSMHCSANQSAGGDVSLFFGLSGTGKTTLSADPHRDLIGDDEHVWDEHGVSNIEGGCYAKCINLSAEKEPEIYNAIRFGALLENVVLDDLSRIVDFTDDSLTENTRVSYPIEYIPHAHIPCTAGHPSNIIFLTCDAFGVLPPISRLTPAQAMYHFVSGYTAKVAGTEVGVTEPQPIFSECFGGPFLVWHPLKYAELLAELMQRHGANAWLINTGWSGGAYGTGARISLPYTRAIIDGVHSGALHKAPTAADPIFGLHAIQECPHVPSELLTPRKTWTDKAAYDKTARKLAWLFKANFAKYSADAGEEVKAAGPVIDGAPPDAE